MGFDIDSKTMVSLTHDKNVKLLDLSNAILKQQLPKIREVAGLIGLLVSYTSGVEYANAHFKYFELDLIKALKRAKGNFDNTMWISLEGMKNIWWWKDDPDSTQTLT